MKTEQIAERKPLPDDEIRLAKEACVEMGECAATYHIITGLNEIERLKALLSAAEAERDRLRNERNVAMVCLTKCCTPEQIHEATSQILVARAALDAGKEQG